MIPLNTPPGTEIVCVRADTEFSDPYLTHGSVYTIHSWDRVRGGPALNLCEIGVLDNWAFDPDRFRLLEIHPSLTALLDIKSVDAEQLLGTEIGI